MEKTEAGCRGAPGRPRCPGKEAAILGAARTLLADRGFTRMTLDEVARVAGVSKATVHLRWRTKAELAAAALSTLRPAGTATPTGDPRADLVAQLADFADTMIRSGGMALVGTCLAEEGHTPELLDVFREYAVLPRRAAIRRTLDRARRRGTLAADTDPDALTSALLGAFHADYLAGRVGAAEWAERTVAAVIGASPAC
jgi:AcrR family transcriptional regulator